MDETKEAQREALSKYLTQAYLLLTEGGEDSEYRRISEGWKQYGDLGELIRTLNAPG